MKQIVVIIIVAFFHSLTVKAVSQVLVSCSSVRLMLLAVLDDLDLKCLFILLVS